jgi:hypothetical protein
MGERQVGLFRTNFNRSIRVQAASKPLTEDAGALALREVSDSLGLREVVGTLLDHRASTHITHPLYELVLSRVLLLAQGWQDQDDADVLRDDPAFRMAVSERGGDRALRPAREGCREPDGLASQPTQSRLTSMLGSEHNRRGLRWGLLRVARERMRRVHGHRRRIVLDVDSFPPELHGGQEGCAYNGHYRMAGYHPLVAITDTGDIVGVMLRPGNVHTAKDVRRFLMPIIQALQEDCDELLLRIDAGYADGKLFAWLRERKVWFVTRLRNNKALQRQVSDWETKTLADWAANPSPDGRPRHATREFWHRVKTWTWVVRVVAVVVERDTRQGELLHHTFYLATSLARPQATSEVILETYRARGTAEAHIGEFKRVIAPKLSSVQRHRNGTPHKKRKVGMAENEVTLLLAAIAYELVHAIRCLLKDTTGEGMSLDRVRERVLKVATVVVRHARAVWFRIAAAKSAVWEALAHAMPGFLASAEVAV